MTLPQEDVTEAVSWGFINCSEDERQVASTQENSVGFVNPSQPLQPLNQIHVHTQTSNPVQKNIYRQCTRGYIHIYFFTEKKRQPF